MPTISIHQPNLCPRRSYFEKIEQSDIFVLLTYCQFTKGGFQNRFNVGDKFYNMAVNQGTQSIREKQYKNPERDWKKICEAFPVLSDFTPCVSKSLDYTNSRIIVNVAVLLGVGNKIVYDYPTELTGTERLVDICKKHGATKYLSGISGRNYLNLSLFEEAGISVEFQDESKMDKRPMVEWI